MKTLFSIGLLAVYAVAAGWAAVFVLNIAGLPGAIAAGKAGARSKNRFIFGSFVSAFGQSAVYLAYTIFIVNWTRLAINYQKCSIVLWPFAFLAVILPLWGNLIHARVEDRENDHANPQVEALHLTFIATLIAFFVFAFFPSVGTTIYGWVPYMN